jgi:hypothetical protein
MGRRGYHDRSASGLLLKEMLRAMSTDLVQDPDMQRLILNIDVEWDELGRRGKSRLAICAIQTLNEPRKPLAA